MPERSKGRKRKGEYRKPSKSILFIHILLIADNFLIHHWVVAQHLWDGLHRLHISQPSATLAQLDIFNFMLPKDLLKYAKKFSPAEIEKAILDAISRIGKAIPALDQDYYERLARLQLAQLQSGPWGTISTSTSTPSYTTYTTTNAIGTSWTAATASSPQWNYTA